MVQLGKYNHLTVIKKRSVGVFFDGGELGDILMPGRHMPDEEPEEGDELEVFIFLDADDRLTATSMIPKATLGEVAYLEAVSIQRTGAYLDWGLTKDLFIPRSVQVEDMEMGKFYPVKIQLGNLGRIIGTNRLKDCILEEDTENKFKEGQQVSLMLIEDSALGFRSVINHTHWGLLYGNEHYKSLKPGQMVTGYIKKKRDDGKLDVSLIKPGYDSKRIDDLADRIFQEAQLQGGVLGLHDKSPPEEIHATFEVSKKNFKIAIGRLYKNRRIAIEPTGIRVIQRPKRAKSLKNAALFSPGAKVTKAIKRTD